jgi:hypothetical protein
MLPRLRRSLLRWLVVLAFAARLAFAGGAARATPSDPARGEPRAGVSEQALEDLVAAGDVDGDDPLRLARALPRASAGRVAARSAPGGSAWVSLVGFTGSRDAPAGGATAASEMGAAVVVGLPLDRLSRAGPGAARALPRAAAFAPATAPDPTGRSVAPERARVASRFARACVAAAWRASGVGPDDARIDAVTSRARWSAILPEARVRAVRGEDQRASLEASTDASRARGSAGADLALEARLTWRLDRLLFADDEPSFERLRLDRHEARLRIAARVLEALFLWQRATAALPAGPGSEAGAFADPDMVLRAAEAEATLDVLTDGWFSEARR